MGRSKSSSRNPLKIRLVGPFQSNGYLPSSSQHDWLCSPTEFNFLLFRGGTLPCSVEVTRQTLEMFQFLGAPLQKVSLPLNTTTRGSVLVPLIRPNVLELMLVSGFEKFTWLKAFRAFARNVKS